MKITHFISSPASGGAEVYVKDLSIAMSKLGHEVHILFLSNAADIDRDLDFESNFLADLSAANVGFSFVGNKTRKNFLLGVRKLRLHINSFNPDVLHCHLYYSLIFSLFAFGTKVIYTHHSIQLRVSSFLYKIFDLRVSSYIGICHACSNMLSIVSDKRVVQINNAVSGNRIIPKVKPNKNIVPVVLMIGRLTKQKNYKLLLDIVKLLSDKEFVVKIAGEGPELESLNINVKESGLESKIQFLGNVNNISESLYSADIFAMTSSWEGLPISLIEATLTGLPTIVTNVGGCAEIAHQCLNGFVMEGFSAEDFADKLKLLIESDELRRQLGDNALRLSQNYKLESSVFKHICLYEKVTN